MHDPFHKCIAMVQMSDLPDEIYSYGPAISDIRLFTIRGKAVPVACSGGEYFTRIAFCPFCGVKLP